MKSFYDYTDQVIGKLNRRYLRLFSKLNLLPFDELNIIQTVTGVYQSALRQVKAAYLDLAIYCYLLYCDSGTKEKQKAISAGWIEKLLDEYDAVTKYRFSAEAERKKQRLIEAIISCNSDVQAYAKKQKYTGRKYEIEKALRQWSLQSSQFAIKITDRAVLQAYLDSGVERVRWNAMEDGRVCSVCRDLDGQIFEIHNVPPKPHYNCRCWLEAVRT